MHKGEIIDSKNGYNVIDCQTCGFFHIDPIPSDEDLKKIYQNEYYSSEKPVYLKEAQEDLDWWEAVYGRYYGLLKKYTAEKSILDIGSGPGYFLKTGCGLGWKTLGFEPSKQAFEYSRNLGLNVINDFFSPEKINEKFGTVSAIDVIEHLPDPTGFLRNAKSVLNKNGLLFLVSPNDYEPAQNLIRTKMGFDSWWVAPPHHISYFNFKSITALLKKSGFEILETTTNFPMPFFLLSGKNYVLNPKIGKDCHKMRKFFETSMYKNNPEFLNSLYGFLAEKGTGRDFIIISRSK